jgi:hypothetical protein
MSIYLSNAIFLVAALLSIAVAQDDGTDAASACPLACSHGGTCEAGSADYSNHPKEPNGTPFLFLAETSRDGWFCNCTVGWTGIHCARPYSICPVKGETGNPHICYHGGTCIEGMEDNVNITSNQRFCDCSKASHDGIPYFGQFCELEGAEQCAPGSEIFCTSGGTCVDGFEEKAHPCECPEGHRGPHCEFLRGQLPDCVLECPNGGKCTLGLRNEYQNLWAAHDGNFQYCVSTVQGGFWSIRCQHRDVIHLIVWLLFMRIPIRPARKAGLGMLANFQVSNVATLIVLTVEHVLKP